MASNHETQLQILAELKNVGQLSNLDRRLSELEKKQAVAEFNTLARLRNVIASPTKRLSPLRTAQNEVVPDFPLFLGDIDILSTAALDSLFRQFNLPIIPGAAKAARRNQFKGLIGIEMTL
ncbi:hypothetical protein RUND412_002835 [Rhizina undulata]